MARITVEDCLKKIGNENRFALINLAVERVKQHRKGQPFMIKCKNKEIVCTLREIAAGKISFDNIREFDTLPETEEVAATGAENTTEEQQEDTAA